MNLLQVKDTKQLQKQKEHKKFLEGLKKKSPKNLDYIVQETHEEVFEKIDCLQCANCCKTTGPLYTEKDIERISRHLRMKPADFEAKYSSVTEITFKTDVSLILMIRLLPI